MFLIASLGSLFAYDILDDTNAYGEALLSLLLRFSLAISLFVFLKGFLFKKERLFSWLGRCSFQIYLMHVVLIALVRRGLYVLNCYNWIIHLSLGILVGIMLPIILSKIPIIDMMIYPRKHRKSTKTI